jgi:hypothetical protein
MTEKNVERLVQVGFGVMLAIFAVFITSGGVEAVYERHWQVTTRASRGLILVSQSGKWITVYEGRDAQVAGVGLISMGLLFAVWSIGLQVQRMKPPTERPGSISKLSALLFTTAVTLLLPPWSITKSAFVTTFWLTVIVWTVGMFAVIRHGERLRSGAPILALFVATLLTGFVAPLRASGGVLLGFIVTMLAFFQAMFVYPPWRKLVIDQSLPWY